jgi:hypothetical protein
MKKLNFKSIAAMVALALVGISSGLLLSFGTVSEAIEVEQTEPALYWYEVDLVNNELGAQKNTSPLTKSQVMSSSLTQCNDTAPEICLRGFETEQNEGDPFTAPPTDEHRINKENP